MTYGACIFKSQSWMDCEIYNELDELLTNAQFLFCVLKTGRPTAHQIIF
jgi:hypothetical protein